MAELQVLRWLMRRAAIRPLAWLLAIALLLLPIWVIVAGPFGGGGTTGLAARAYHAVAFLGGVGAAAFTLQGLGDLRGFGAKLAPVRRLRLASIVLAIPTSAAVTVLLLPLTVIAPQALFSANTEALGLAVAHVVALALLLDQLPLARGTRSFLLPLLAWVLPALVPSGAPGSSALIGVFDAASLLRIESAPPEVTAACASILAWVLTSIGLATLRPEGS